MSINLPSRQVSRSASKHLQCTHHSITPAQSYLPLILLTRSQSPPCRDTRGFQTSSSCHKVKSLRPDAYTSQTNEAAMKPSTPVKPKTTTARTLVKDETRSTRPAQIRMDIQKRAEAAAARARARIAEQQQTKPRQGSLAGNSLFADVQQLERPRDTGDMTTASQSELVGLDPTALELRNPSSLAAALNPRPEARSRWQRRMVIRSVRQRGRLSKAVKIARAERSSLSRSHFFKTSMKKLAPLARQIAGKHIDEAILQMRFSKKKVAQEVRAHLIQAKNEAIVARGMGLGHLEQSPQNTVPQPPAPPPPQHVDLTPPLPSSNTTTTTNTTPLQPTASQTRTPKPSYLPGTLIPTNPSLRPPTSIYISQAWINRGPYEEKPDYRAFGRMNIMRPPSTAISVLLKEEKTRAREASEKETKKIRRRMGKGMWTQLPDRKVTRQGQYLLW